MCCNFFILFSARENLFSKMIKMFQVQLRWHWWLKLEDVTLGYWPNTIFTGLATVATKIQWEGEIYNATPEGSHTTTQMGSGHFSSEGFGKSSHFKNIGNIDTSGNTRLPVSIVPFMTNHACYDLLLEQTKTPNSFFYGGPGSSATCRWLPRKNTQRKEEKNQA